MKLASVCIILHGYKILHVGSQENVVFDEHLPMCQIQLYSTRMVFGTISEVFTHIALVFD